jgi:hypothetical protein
MVALIGRFIIANVALGLSGSHDMKSAISLSTFGPDVSKSILNGRVYWGYGNSSWFRTFARFGPFIAQEIAMGINDVVLLWQVDLSG